MGDTFCRRQAVAFLATLLWGTTSHAASYYVRTSGDDANDGLRPESAFATIGHAAGLLINGGDRVVVGPGTYHEGNIAPRRGGLPGDPVQFIADRDGAMTGDTAGEVRIVPAAEGEEQTTGFILFGKRHVVIEGFTIVGARDAGIQVRPTSRTASDSADITVRGNRVSDGTKGIDVTGVGELRVEANVASNNSTSGISVVAGSGDTEISVRGNRLTGNLTGLYIDGGTRVFVRENEAADNGRAMRIDNPRELTIVSNRLTANEIGIDLGGNDPLGASGQITIEANSLSGGYKGIRSQTRATLRLTGNTVASMFAPLDLFGYAPIEVSRNLLAGSVVKLVGPDLAFDQNKGGFHIEARGRSVSMSGNSGISYLLVAADAKATLSGNQAFSAEIRARDVSMSENQLTGDVELRDLVTAVIASNVIAQALVVEPRSSRDFGRTAARAAVLGAGLQVEGNQLGGVRLGSLAVSFDGDVLFQRNAVSNAVKIYAGGDASVLSNRISSSDRSGLTLSLYGATSRLAVANNVVSECRYDGMLLSGARGGVIEDNQISDNGDTGITIRGSAGITIQRNTVRGNAHGGIGIDTASPFVTDCDGDGTVSSLEMAMAIRLALRSESAAACAALDTTEDLVVTVDELVAAVTDSAATRPTAIASRLEQVVADNRIEDNQVYGIKIFTKQPTRMQGNVVQRSAGVGITLTGYEGAALVAQSNQIEDSADTALRLAGAGVAEAIGNIASGSGDNGIHVDGAEQVRVLANQVTDSRHIGIVVEDAGTIRCAGNSVVRGQAGGIELMGTRGGAAIDADATDNRIEDSGGDGLLLEGARRGTVADNEIVAASLDGISVRRSRFVTVADNRISGAGMFGIVVGDESDAGPGFIIERNRIADSGASGIRAHGSEVVVARDNQVLRSGISGIYLAMQGDPAQAVAVGNTIGGSAAYGLFATGLTRATLQNNVIFNSLDTGILVRSSRAVQVANNLVYANGRGIRIGSGESPEDRVEGGVVISNTIFQNHNAGLVIGSSSAASTDAYVEHNIIHANGTGGFFINSNSLPGLSADFNLNTDGYRESPFDGELTPLLPGAHDIDADPLFVDPDGVDGILAGDGYLDDDFRLRSGAPASPAIDAGREVAITLGISGFAAEGTTFDAALVDLGYHYDASPRIE